MKYRFSQCLLVAVVIMFAAGGSIAKNELVLATQQGQAISMKVLLGEGANMKTETTEDEASICVFLAAKRSDL
ncbi:hypothetical protein A7E78_12390 [Syntrophotalea acetylenivorans]|uniref:Uncharacterized protein n=1 Tax=Syntrophotalea acetylenivorans TaxID=1842532 RepID=A0A1L3GRJ7_9BACT|nr:hypothetical protein [Syntrophotalea acetylenivorans]APG28571.1 hypothetical protein A7E78_12390 [Syntrophotalea acetylenivorans]